MDRFRGWFKRSYHALLTGLALGTFAWVIETGVVMMFGNPHDPDPALELITYQLLAVGLTMVLAGRRRAENELRKLSQAVEQSPALVQITDLEGRIEYVNPKFTEVTGYTLDEVRHHKPSILRSGETLSEEYARLWQTITSGNEWHGEFHNKKKNGELYWEHAVIGPVKDAAGRTTHYVAVKEDITARKAAEAAEREQRSLAEALRDIATALNSTLKFEEVLDRILSNLDRVIKHDVAVVHLIEDGATRVVGGHDLTGRRLADVGKALRMRVDEVPDLRRAYETGRCQITPYTKAAPDWVSFPEHDWICSNAIVPLLQEGQVIGFLELSSATPHFFTARDAERLQGLAIQVSLALRNARLYRQLEEYATHQAEQVAARTAELAQQTQLLETVLGTMGEGVVLIENGQIRYFNRALNEMFGYSAEEFPLSFREAFRLMVKGLDVETALAESSASFEQHRLWHTEIKMRHKDGRELDVAVASARVYDKNQQGSVTVLRDITEQKALAARRELFLTHATHELRTPLANIKARLYLLRQQPDRLNTHLEVLDQVTANMHGLIEDLLDLLRLGRHEAKLVLQTFELQPILRRLIGAQQPLLSKKSATLSDDLSADPLVICGDQRRLNQALTRLLIHTINYVPPDGRVMLQLTSDDHHARLRLYHEWPGMENAAPNQAFEQFLPDYQAQGAGLGLGLAMAAEIIKLHQGTITVENEPGNHSVLVVSLPREQGC